MAIYYTDPREHVVRELKSVTSPEQWFQNGLFINDLKARVFAHPLFKSHALAMLNEGEANLSLVKRIHLDYRFAIVKIFTDALLMAQFLARDIEDCLPPPSKIAPRFLLTLNLLDEIGFSPNQANSDYYQGNVGRAHYPLYEDVLDQLGISLDEREAYKASQPAVKLKIKLENTYQDYLSVIALLAIAEQQVIAFSPALKRSLIHLGVDVSEGYYHVHGASTDTSLSAADDDHENDLWLLLQQSLTREDLPRIESLCLSYCDLWMDFWCYHSSKVDESNALCNELSIGVL